MSTTSPRRELQSQSAVDSTTQPRQSIWQRTYSTIGFTKGYNFPLFIILAGAMFGFCLARLSYLNVDTNLASGASPGEWYWLRAGHYRIGITMHLATILPAGLLMVWQFVPIIRHKALLFHRINGYVVMLLVAVSHVGALMIVRRSFGGLLSTQAATGFLAIASAVAIVMAYWNVKKLQIDQHRAWMLRAMVWMGSIITLRIIMIIAVQITALVGSYNLAVSCDEINFVNDNDQEYVLSKYPQCRQDPSLSNRAESPNSTSIPVVVQADFTSSRPEELGAGLKSAFGMAFWLALVLHMFGTEVYLSLTPAEANRLRNVSYRRQLEAGHSNPGNAGWTVQKFGDAPPWSPDEEKKTAVEQQVENEIP